MSIQIYFNFIAAEMFNLLNPYFCNCHFFYIPLDTYIHIYFMLVKICNIFFLSIKFHQQRWWGAHRSSRLMWSRSSKNEYAHAVSTMYSECYAPLKPWANSCRTAKIILLYCAAVANIRSATSTAMRRETMIYLPSRLKACGLWSTLIHFDSAK